jgi:ubiquinone/menaquinone biosynthesis C-methylase UbiE
VNSDRIARWYAALEYMTFGRALLTCRCRQLEQCRLARKVLMLGEGDGRFLERFLLANSDAQVDYLDLSHCMLARARARLSAAQQERVRFHHADSRQFLPGSKYDTIVTHFFLDCLSAPEAIELTRILARATTQDAQWIISEFDTPRQGWRRLRARVWIAALYRAFHWLTRLEVSAIPDYAGALEQAGFRLQSKHTASAGLLTSELWRKVI